MGLDPNMMLQFILADRAAQQRQRQQEELQRQQENRKFLEMFTQLPPDAVTPDLLSEVDRRFSDPGIRKILDARVKHAKRAQKQEQLGGAQGQVAAQLENPLITPSSGAGALSRDEVLARLNTLRSLGQQQGLSQREAERSLQAVDVARESARATGKVDALKEARELRKQAYSDESSLRDDFTALSKEFITQRNAYDRVVASAEDPTPEGDFALIFNFMKVLDPGSTVREGEFASVQNAPGVPAGIQAWYNQLVGNPEGRLPDKVRRRLVDRSRKLFSRAKERQKSLEGEFRDLSKRNDLNPANVILDFRSDVGKPAADTTPPQDEPTAEFVGRDTSGNPIFKREDGRIFIEVPD